MERRPFVCRNCGSSCPVVVTVDDGRVLAVAGDFDAPLYRGYTCPKARAIPQEHHRPDRLLHSLKRLPDGRRVPISSEQLVDEIAERLSRILDAHGPHAVAAFLGNGVAAQPAASGMMLSFLAAIGSPMMFSPGTIDQPGLLTAKALHGGWQGGRMHPSQWETLLVVGGGPQPRQHRRPVHAHQHQWPPQRLLRRGDAQRRDAGGPAVRRAVHGVTHDRACPSGRQADLRLPGTDRRRGRRRPAALRVAHLQHGDAHPDARQRPPDQCVQRPLHAPGRHHPTRRRRLRRDRSGQPAVYFERDENRRPNGGHIVDIATTACTTAR